MRSDLDWVSITDFRPGIVSAAGHIVGEAVGGALGTADFDGTYGCMASPTGALVPLPPLAADYTRAKLGISGVTTYGVTPYLFGPKINVTGSRPDYPAPGGAVGPGPPGQKPYPFELWIAFHGSTSGGDTYYRLVRDRVYDSSTFTPTGSAVHRSFGPLTDAKDLHTATFFDSVRLTNATPTLVGAPLVMASWYQAKATGGSLGSSFTQAFPDPQGVVGAGGYAFPAQFAGPIFAHQNRLVCLQRRGEWVTGYVTDGNDGGANPTVKSNEVARWTKPNEIALDAATGTVFTPDNVIGYGAWASVTASDLLLVKHYGGAVLIQGDLNAPIVRSLRAVASTHGTEQVGAMTPIGFVYGQRGGGIYAWQGEDGAMPLSPQMHSNFWHPTQYDADTKLYDYGGRFAHWQNLILVPGGFVYDTINQSWWQLEKYNATGSDRPFSYLVDPLGGYFLAATLSATEGATNFNAGWMRLYDPYISGSNRSEMQWTSQPIRVPLADRQANVREVIVEFVGNASPLPTFTVTLFQGDATVSVAQVPAAATVGIARFDIATPTQLADPFIRIRLNLNDASGLTTVPVIRAIHIGFKRGQHVRRSS